MIASYTASAVASAITASSTADPVGDGLEVPSGVRILVDISPLPCIGECGALPATGAPLSAMLLAAGLLLLLTGCAMFGRWRRTDRRATYWARIRGRVRVR